MQHERFNQHLFQALTQAGLEPVSFRERLDLGSLTREIDLSATLPGREWPTRVVAEFSYFWSAADTARSFGAIDADPLGDVVDLTCTLKYSPLKEEYTVQVADVNKLREFLRALVERLPPALKDERGGNTAEVHLLMGEDADVLLYGPVLYQLNQVIDVSDDEEEDEDGNSLSERDLDAALRDLAADALRGLMALDALQPPDGLFMPLPEDEEEEDYDEDEEEVEDDED